ncbi:MAG TPA: hypothetical protein VN026_08280 [Bacteroidia bacterium]|jgi:hypothetical protein|nr:hypothetical protein [Bacteroidia bacterium]
MDTQTLKQKIKDGNLSDTELEAIIGNNNKHHRGKGNFLKSILKGYTDAVTVPNMWKATLESLLILIVIIGAIILSYSGKMDNTITAVLLAAVLGFLFGKLR